MELKLRGHGNNIHAIATKIKFLNRTKFFFRVPRVPAKETNLLKKNNSSLCESLVNYYIKKMAVATNDKNVSIATIALLLDDEEQQQQKTLNTLYLDKTMASP